MLTLTDNASTMIGQLLDNPDLPPGSGLRIARESGAEGPELAVGTAPAPQADDQIIEEGDARVFLGPTAAAVLEDKVLDAVVEADGKVRFQVARQP